MDETNLERGSASSISEAGRCSRHMEGDKYILFSGYWGALHEIESALQPQAADSPTLTSLRAAMYHDHFTNRVTLNTSIESPLHVLMHLLDPRYEISLFLRNSHPEHWPSFFLFNVDGACVVILSSLNSSGTKPRTVRAICTSILSSWLPGSCFCPLQRRCSTTNGRVASGPGGSTSSRGGCRCSSCRTTRKERKIRTFSSSSGSISTLTCSTKRYWHGWETTAWGEKRRKDQTLASELARWFDPVMVQRLCYGQLPTRNQLCSGLHCRMTFLVYLC